MVSTYVTAYALAWAVATLIVFLASRHLMDRANPPEHRASISLAAGAVWPVLILGVFEAGLLALFSGGGGEGPSEPEDALGADVVSLS